MAQNITLMGASYSDVPAVTLPKTGGGTATFADTSDADAAASDIASGKTAYVDGVKITGTGSGGGGVTVSPLSVTANGIYTAPSGEAYSPVTVNVSGGGGSVEEKAVNFRDYDGTVVYSYTAAEFAALTALPANPSHTGLIAQGWNWTLSDAKTYVASYGRLEVGQMYTTSSGDTEIDCVFDNPSFLSPWLSIAVNGTVEVDWGDNSTADTMTGTSNTTLKFQQHVYAQTGEYTISIHVVSGQFTFYNTNGYVGVLRTVNATSMLAKSRTYSSAIRHIRFGIGAKIGQYAFAYCISLQSVANPYDMTLGDAYVFNYCYSLKYVVIPSGSTNMGGRGIFSYCYALESVSLPRGITSWNDSLFTNCFGLTFVAIPNGGITLGSGISTSWFSFCHKLKEVILPNDISIPQTGALFRECSAMTEITIPSGVSTISVYAFYSCLSLAEIHFKASSPPTVSSSNAFSNLPTNCKIYVPAGSLAAYTSATNYPSSSTYTYIEE